jgi:translation initiation factor 3 subunit H
MDNLCLQIPDTAKTAKGFLSLKAYRLTPQAIELYKAKDFTPDTIKNLKVTYDNLFQEVPIVIKNSHLVNELLLELSEQIPSEAGSQFLDLGTADVLESQLKGLMDTVDELNQESIKFNKYQTMAVKQFQDKTRYLQKRQLDNNARTARGEDPLAEEDIGKIFKPIVPPPRLNSLILSGQILSSADQVQQFCSQSMAKWFGTEALQDSKAKQGSTT